MAEYVKKFNEFIKESHEHNTSKYWSDELSELAYHLEELNTKYSKDYVFTYDGSQNDPKLFVNGIPFLVDFLSAKEDVGGVLVDTDGSGHNVAFVQSDDGESNDYTIGSNDAVDVYEMIMRKV